MSRVFFLLTRRGMIFMSYEQTLNYALQITLVGMSLVFMAIVVLWGLILLVVRFTAERETGDSHEESVEAIPVLPDHQQQAAAAAVAVALALQSMSTNHHQVSSAASSTPPQLPRTSVASPWKTALRTTEMSQGNTLGWVKTTRSTKNQGKGS